MEKATAGERADAAWTLINRAGGDLGGMVIRKKLSRDELSEILKRLDQATQLLRSIL